MTQIHGCHLLISLSGDKDVRDAMPSFLVNNAGWSYGYGVERVHV